MSHTREPAPTIRSAKTHQSLVGDFIRLVIAGSLLLPAILPIFRKMPVAAVRRSRITDSFDWRILLVLIGSLAYYIYSRRLRGKLWWIASRMMVWLTIIIVGFWLYRVVLPEIAPGSEFAILTILVALATPVLRRLYGSRETGALLQEIERLSSKIKLNLAVAADYNDRGFDYLQLGDNQKAVFDFDRAIELDPQYAVAYNNRGLAYHYQGQSDKALADLNRAIELKPDYADAYNNRALAYSRQGRFADAISEYSRALEIEPNFALVYHNRGMDYYKMGEFEKALADLQTSKRLAGNYFSGEAGRLVAQLEKGKRPQYG